MATQSEATRTTRFKIGWIGLLAISVLMALNHIVLIFAMSGEAVLFLGWAAFNLLSIAVLYFPFRKGERWSWYAAWILVIAFASPILFDANAIGIVYLIVAAVCAVALLLTRPAFFQKAA